MIVSLNRFIFSPSATLGEMFIDSSGQELIPFCYTLELPFTDGMKGSAVPDGDYEIYLRYSPRFEKFLPTLKGKILNEYKREHILIHAGNTVEDTEGCILLGNEINIENEELKFSRYKVINFISLLRQEEALQKKSFLTIKKIQKEKYDTNYKALV